MTGNHLRIAYWCHMLLAPALIPSSMAWADTPVDVGTSVRIESAVATPGNAGGRSSIRFKLINDSSSSLHLLGLVTPVAEQAELVARTGPDKASRLQSITISKESVLDLTTSHLRFEVDGLLRALIPGEEFPMTLRFVGFSVPVVVHVH